MPALLPKQHAAHATLANLALALTLASTFLSHTELQSVSAATTQQHATQDCQPATCYAPGGISLSRGRRARMEDRVVCNPQLTKLQDQVLSLYVVLDGHEGHAASEFAARRLPEALKQHLHQVLGAQPVTPAHLEQALRAAVADVDAEFLSLAQQHSLPDGTTAVIALLHNGTLTVANLGDSRATLCRAVDCSASRCPAAPSPASASRQQSQSTVRQWRSAGKSAVGDARAQHSMPSLDLPPLEAVSLTDDHNPGRPDEQARLNAAGGRVEIDSGGKARLQGELAVSRAIGDLPYRQHGLISEPEFSHQQLSPRDHFLVLASDGVFESLDEAAICGIAQAVASGRHVPMSTTLDSLPLAMPPAGESFSTDVQMTTNGGDTSLAAGSTLPRHQTAPATSTGASLYGCSDCGASSSEAAVAAAKGDTDLRRPHALPQCIAEVLQSEAYTLKSGDNLAVVVVALPGASIYSQQWNHSAQPAAVSQTASQPETCPVDADGQPLAGGRAAGHGEHGQLGCPPAAMHSPEPKHPDALGLPLLEGPSQLPLLGAPQREAPQPPLLEASHMEAILEAPPQIPLLEGLHHKALEAPPQILLLDAPSADSQQPLPAAQPADMSVNGCQDADDNTWSDGSIDHMFDMSDAASASSRSSSEDQFDCTSDPTSRRGSRELQLLDPGAVVSYTGALHQYELIERMAVFPQYPPHLHMDADGQPRPHLPAPRFLPALWDPQLQMSQRMLDSVPVDHQALPPLPGVEDMSYIDAQTAIVQRGSSELLPNSAICGAPRHDGLADAGFSGTSQDVGVDGTCTAADQNVPQLGPAQNALVRVIGALPLEQRNMAERLEFWQHRYRQGSLSSAPSLLDHPVWHAELSAAQRASPRAARSLDYPDSRQALIRQPSWQAPPLDVRQQTADIDMQPGYAAHDMHPPGRPRIASLDEEQERARARQDHSWGLTKRPSLEVGFVQPQIQHRHSWGAGPLSPMSPPYGTPPQMQAGGWGSPYNLEQQFARGGFGEVWRAVLRPTAAQQAAGGLEPEGPFVMKRMMTEHGEDVRLSGLREAYFGNLLRQPPHLQATGPGAAPDQQAGSGYDHLVRFMESFEAGTDLWLVFRDEGTSLHSLMYSSTLHTNPFPDSAQPPGPEGRAPGGGGVQMLQPSAWWWRLRQASEGEGVIRDLLFQLIKGLEVLHAANITHRDIKPENLLLQPADLAGDSSACNLRIIDFGSAVDPYSIHHLYGPEGPSDAQQTFEYAPPEAVLGRYWQGTPMVKRTWPYDMWSVGICWLELLMGTPHVFQISAKTRALLHHHLHLDEKSEGERTLAYLLRGYMELCIYPPRPFTRATPPNEPPAQPGQPPGAGTTSAGAVDQPRTALQQQAAAAGNANGTTAPSTTQRGQQAQHQRGPAVSSFTTRNASAPQHDGAREGRRPTAPPISPGPQDQGSGGQETGGGLVSWSCTEQAILDLIQSRDPTHRGLPNKLALRLLQRLLSWGPGQRPTASQALRHAFFTVPLDQQRDDLLCSSNPNVPGWC